MARLITSNVNARGDIILEADLWIVQLLESNLGLLSEQPGRLIAVNLALVPSPQLPPTI